MATVAEERIDADEPVAAAGAVEKVDAADVAEDVPVVAQDVDADVDGVAAAYAASDVELVPDTLPPLLA